MGAIGDFIRHHYRHFNSATLVDAADAYTALVDNGGAMLVTLAGAMSTAELGLSLAEMIRRGKVHAICCTGANLEEDLFNLVAHEHYLRIPEYRNLTAAQEVSLAGRGLNRVTDTCIPEAEAMRRVAGIVLEEWRAADRTGQRRLPHEFLYRALRSGAFTADFQIDPSESWLVAACDADLPLFVPGWEDSTLGNMYAAHCIDGSLEHTATVRSGIEYMIELVEWYETVSRDAPVGFFPDRRRHRRRFPHLRGTVDRAGSAPPGCTQVGLFLPDQRFNHELRILFRRGTQREDHLGKAVGGHARVYHRIRCHDRGAVDIRSCPGLVTCHTR